MKKWLCGILMISLLMTCFAAFAEETGAEAAQSGAEWTYPVSLMAIESKYAVLVNTESLLDQKFVPDPKVKIKGVQKATNADVYMEETAADALKQMFADAALVSEYTYVTEKGKEKVAEYQDGMTLYLKSGYRSYGQQATIHANYLARNNGVDDGYVAKPGSSEHQSGLCADILNKEYAGKSRMTQEFKWSPEAQWMKENAADYGFILRFPEELENETGIKFEPWHFRYVGKEIATYITDMNMSLEGFTKEAQQAVEAFEAAGGSKEEQIAYEMKHANKPPETFITDEYGSDGDAEISMVF